MVGKTLGHYQITSQLGKGGMGEVFQAKDQILGRDVAIKVLPEEFARDTDRVARFQREAKVLASLNHPNIAAIHGLEQSEGKNFLVLELVQGQTLADRIKAGPIPVEESLKLALQIAEALEAAHERGVIHRDLKPSNIKVTPDGKVKVLDFGLAKAYAGDKEEVNLSNSPTLSDAATQQGVILGTAAYMSPEQARGKSVDRKADVWAFGCVLFEMLAGHAAFSGKDVTDILAAVIRAEPEWNSLSANVHWRLREVLERCLKKDAKERYHDISDVKADIQRILTLPSGVLMQPSTTMGSRTKLRAILPWVAVTAIVCIIAAGVAVWKLKPPETKAVIRFAYELPEGQQLSSLDQPINVSPDGKQIVYGTSEGLYLRSANELTARPIPGSDKDSAGPFFSPDGKSIGYFSVGNRKLKKIAIAGGAPTILCNTNDFGTASWDTDDSIVYSTGTNIMRISSKGGTPETLVEKKSERFFNPQILPDENLLLYTAATSNFSNPRIMAKPRKSEEPKELFPGWLIRYLPSGHIFYWDGQNNVWAVQFDVDRLEAVSEHVSMIQGADDVAISDSGTLAYTLLVPQEAAPKHTLVWVDREGKEEPLGALPNQYSAPKISPDGKRVALVIGTLFNEDIYIWDIVRKTLNKLTLDETRDMQPIWTSDNKRIIYWSNHEDANQGGIYWRAADGSGKFEKLCSASDRILFPWSISRDGTTLLVQELVSLTNADIGFMSMEGNRTRKSLLQNEYSEAQPMISPDGRWMAYASSESTGEAFKTEIYIRPIPNVEESKTQVSAGAGNSPLWSPDGRELYYLNNENAVMSVSVQTEPSLSLGTPRILFRSTNQGLTPTSGQVWDIHPNGKRFLMLKPPAGTGAATITGPRKINIVLNWFEELKQRVPIK